MELTIGQALHCGISAHKEGKLQDAERFYRAVLRSHPSHPDANHNLGVLAVTVNNVEAGLPLFRNAIEANPRIEQFWLSYINALVKAQRLKDAKLAIKKAKKKGFDTNKLRRLLSQSKGLTGRAIPSEFCLDSLSEHMRNGRFIDAEKLSLKIIQDFPDHEFAWRVLGAVLWATNRRMEARDAYQKVVALSPHDAPAHYYLGRTLKEIGRLDDAEVSLRQAVVLKPDYPEAHNKLGETLQKLSRLDEAEVHYSRAIALKPDNAVPHFNLGNMFVELGRLKEAESSYNRALEKKHDFAEAHRLLAWIKKFDIKDEQYLKMHDLSLDKNISEDDLCHIHFGLAKACEDLKNFEQAFKHYREANMLRKKLLNYDLNQDIKLFSQIKSNYPQIERYALKSDKISKILSPVFIVGMPRSGTTLVEQILSSHSKVTGAGELPFADQFGSTIATGITEVNNESILNFRRKYLTKLKEISGENLIVTDKMPQNFRYIGLLAAALPEAKIIHVKRTPAAVCWAIYKQYFESRNLGYCYAIDDIVSYYYLYENLLEFWLNKLNKRIYNLNYELLTVNQENETRRLIDHLGIGWDVNCLSPQNNKRRVATVSTLQIREKVYQGSSKQWKKYEPFLNGALDGLPPF